MQTIQSWIYNLLTSWGLIRDTSGLLDNSIVLLLIIAVTVMIDYLCRYVVLGMFRKVAHKTKNQWDDLVVDRKIINKMMHIVPAILIYLFIPFAFTFEESPATLAFLQKMCLVYMIGVSLRFINASLGVVSEIYNQVESVKNKPLKGFIQILQIIAIFIGGVLIISVLLNKSAVSLFAGLGASAAVLMLVFKDTILGFLAGIQLAANDMLQAGDWITMNKYGANGTVIEVTLNTVKVRNFDNTITTIPPYALVSDAFQNWRGMRESAGRRIKRSINIDMQSIHFCTPELLERLRHEPLLADYLQTVPDHRELTNIGLFRLYLERYLGQLPAVNKELTCFVRHLQPTEHGLPIELYFFSSIKDWIPYEAIQADVFDHVLAILPRFELSVFQQISGYDIRQAIQCFSTRKQPV